MSTDEQREWYKHPGGGFPSDVTVVEWAVLELLIPDATLGGRLRKIEMRSAMNAILFLLRTSCPWRRTVADIGRGPSRHFVTIRSFFHQTIGGDGRLY